MKHVSLLILFFLSPFCSGKHKEGPPPKDSTEYSEYTWYYDININQNTVALPNLDPKYDRALALYMNGNISISNRELTQFFSEIRFLDYGIIINNTNLLNLSFLPTFRSIDGELDDPTRTSISIINNWKMTSLGIDLSQSATYGNITIANNPLLDLGPSCDSIIKSYGPHKTIYGNLVDCGCRVTGNFSNFLKTMKPNCWWLSGDIVIDQSIDYNVLTKKLQNVTKISGGLTIRNTNFTDFSFFESLEQIQTDYETGLYGINDFKSLVITGNKNLTRLGMMPKIIQMHMEIEDNPKLCILAQELDTFRKYLGEDASMRELFDAVIDADVCFDEDTPEYFCELPDVDQLSNLTEDCTVLVGNLLVDKTFDFFNSYKLYNVNTIYGSLHIVNSSLRTLNMFPTSLTIYSTKEKVAPVLVQNNTNLVQLWSRIERIESGESLLIENNPMLNIAGLTCKGLNFRKVAIVRNNLKNCEDYLVTEQLGRNDLNVDFYYGLPPYLDASHNIGTDPNDDGPQNNQPGLGLDTSTAPPEDTTTQKESYHPKIFVFTLMILSINIFDF